MEDELRARAEVAERVAAAVGHPDLEEEEVQWEIGWRSSAKDRMRSCKDMYGQQVPTTWVAPGYNVGWLE